jgi:hypothetical protein
MIGNPLKAAEVALQQRQMRVSAEVRDRLLNRDYLPALAEVYDSLLDGMHLTGGELVEYVEHHMGELIGELGPPQMWHLTERRDLGPNLSQDRILRSFGLSIAATVMMFNHTREERALGYLAAALPEVEVPKIVDAWKRAMEWAS